MNIYVRFWSISPFAPRMRHAMRRWRFHCCSFGFFYAVVAADLPSVFYPFREPCEHPTTRVVSVLRRPSKARTNATATANSQIHRPEKYPRIIVTDNLLMNLQLSKRHLHLRLRGTLPCVLVDAVQLVQDLVVGSDRISPLSELPWSCRYRRAGAVACHVTSAA